MEILNEGVFTSPRADCLYPERWHSTDEQSTELEVSELVAGFIRALQPDYVVETGTFTGQTAHIIGLALMDNGQGVLDTIEMDWDRAQMAFRRCSYPKELPVRINHMSSLNFVPAQPINFAWFDSELDLRIPEFERFRSYLAPGAVCGFHDTGPHKNGGKFAEAIRAIPDTVSLQLPTPRGVTFLQVR